MKDKRNKRRRQSKKTALFLVIRLLLSASAFAVELDPHDAEMLNAIHEMRTKQENEENTVRVIQQPITVTTQQGCSPSELARQRIRDLGAKEGTKVGNVTVEAGHGEVTVKDNHGQIDNSVNVQMVNPDERRCL